MKAVVVYASLWGNTTAIARAVAEGLGEGASALSTAEAVPDTLAGADLIVAGSPLLGFSLPTHQMIENIRTNPRYPPSDVSHPLMRDWLADLPRGKRFAASFETGLWWSFGSAAKTIAEGLEEAGYTLLDKPQRFIVTGSQGPLRQGELERARDWGEKLRQDVIGMGSPGE